MKIRDRVALVLGSVALLAASATTAAALAAPASGLTVSKGGVSWTGTAQCTSNSTSVTKTSSSGGNPGYAARFRVSSTGTWVQGPEVNSGTSTVFGATGKAPQHGIRVFWASGAQNYTFC